jgi:hypothetical protein
VDVAPDELVADTVTSDIGAITGPGSVTVTLKLTAVAGTCELFDALHVTCVVPNPNVLPDAGRHVTTSVVPSS